MSILLFGWTLAKSLIFKLRFTLGLIYILQKGLYRTWYLDRCDELDFMNNFQGIIWLEWIHWCFAKPVQFRCVHPSPKKRHLWRRSWCTWSIPTPCSLCWRYFFQTLIIENWYFVTKIVLTFCEKKNVLVIEKNFWNSRLKAENLQKFWDRMLL